MSVPRKQSSQQDDWLRAIASIEERISYEQYAALRDHTIAEIRANARPGMAYGWSGGKDSLVLSVVAEAAGITDCVLVIADPTLEYPNFLRWVESHRPPGLHIEVIAERNLDWLANNPQMLFPRDAKTAATWFRIVQHTGQARYVKDRNVPALLLGRRRAEGNYVGRHGQTVYTSKGITRWSPIADWTHEDVLACLHYEGLSLPPYYTGPRGFRVGSGPWPSRAGCESEDQGWDETYAVDPEAVEIAAPVFPRAAACLARHGRSM